MEPKKRKSKRFGLYFLLFSILFAVLISILFNAYMFVLTGGRVDSLQVAVSDLKESVQSLEVSVKNISVDTSKKTTASSNAGLSSVGDGSSSNSLSATSNVSTERFSSSDFPFVFQYETDWVLVTEDEPLKIDGYDVSVSEKNEIKLISTDDFEVISEVVGTDADWIDYTIRVQYFNDSSISSARERFYGDEFDLVEKVDDLQIGSYDVQKYEGGFGITSENSYFFTYNDSVIVVSGVSQSKIKALIETVK